MKATTSSRWFGEAAVLPPAVHPPLAYPWAAGYLWIVEKR